MIMIMTDELNLYVNGRFTVLAFAHKLEPVPGAGESMI
jgi:hypothetical protein